MIKYRADYLAINSFQEVNRAGIATSLSKSEIKRCELPKYLFQILKIASLTKAVERYTAQ